MTLLARPDSMRPALLAMSFSCAMSCCAWIFIFCTSSAALMSSPLRMQNSQSLLRMQTRKGAMTHSSSYP